MSDTEQITEYIRTKRPNLSKSSLKTYTSILKSLYKNIFEDDKFDMDKFSKNPDKVIHYLKIMLEPNQRKTSLSALVVITDNKDYRELMLDDIKKYNKEQNKQEKNETQKENWVENNEILDIHKKMLKDIKLLYKKDILTNSDLQTIQNFVIISLLGGIYIPPRRSKDYVDFKIKNIDKEKDNYLDKNKLIFNSYKTAKFYGRQELKIPLELSKILKHWIGINPTEYLLFDSSKNKLSNVKLNQRLNKIFGKKASVNQLRHTYLSDKYGDMIEQKNQMNKDFNDMGSSMLQEKVYIKK
jgi:hypothetical protein